MKLDSVQVKNFRLLEDVSLSLEDVTTVVVGRNNSGKTSLTELFYKLTEKAVISLEDFTLSRCKDFWGAFGMWEKQSDEKAIREKIPCIKVILNFTYDEESADLGILGEFIVDLDPSSNKVRVEVKYDLDDGRLASLLGPITKKAATEEEKRLAFLSELKDRIPTNYSVTIEAVDPNDEGNRKPIELSLFKKLLRFDFINAQRPIENEKFHEGNALSKLLEPIFNAKNAEQASKDDKAVVDELTGAVADVQNAIDTKFKEALETLLPSLDAFGYPGISDSALRTETTLDVSRLLKEHTSLYYEGLEGVNLPERHNGLGTRNLIYILFKLYQAFKQYQIADVAPSAQLVFIEEPEAHLHPQMQEVFIKQIDAVREIFIKDFNENKNWPVQFVVTTHSSHVANKADFRAIRYFLTTRNGGARTTIRDLRSGLATNDLDEKFLHKYLELTRSDLFFADKAILIEGQSERILLPRMIKKNKSKLKSQYVSVVEVGGAHAHIFFEFLKFLELRTLIITDIDSVGADGTKCPVQDGTSTSNNCILTWYAPPADSQEVSDYSPKTLIEKSDIDKTKDYLRIAYQIPEEGAKTEDCGRSFEEAFIRANSSMFAGKNPYEEAGKFSSNKPDFALKYAICDEDWNTPKYIEEGFNWLAKTPKGQVITIVDVTEKDEDAE